MPEDSLEMDIDNAVERLLTTIEDDEVASLPTSPKTPPPPSPRFWIEVPHLPTPVRTTYRRTQDIPIDDEDPVEVFSKEFFIENEGRFGRLIDDFEDARDSKTLEPFDPSSKKVLPADRLSLRAVEGGRNPPRSSKVDRRSGSSAASASEASDDSGEKSDGYEEDFDDTPGRHLRTRAALQKFGPWSPTKRQPPTRSSTRARKQNYADVLVDDESSIAVEDSEDDYFEPGKRSPAAKRQKRKRVSRPAYGFVRPTDDLEEYDSDTSPLDTHRPYCEKCEQGPAHILMPRALKRKSKAGSRKKKKGPDADLMESSEDEVVKTEKLGGWVRCLKCCVAAHWKCLSTLQKTEILTAIRQKEQEKFGANYTNRKTLDWEESTEFVCGSCLRGGICMQCNEPVKTEDPPTIESGAEKNKDDDVVMADAAIDPPEVLKVDATSSSRLLFRCSTCKRPAHYEHIAPLTDGAPEGVEAIAQSYQENWSCQDCRRWLYKLDKIIAWRPYPADAVEAPRNADTPINYKSSLPREYLVKWEDVSFRHLEWVPHMWLLTTNQQKLRNFLTQGAKVRLYPTDHEEVAKAMKLSDPSRSASIHSSGSGETTKAGSPTADAGNAVELFQKKAKWKEAKEEAGTDELPEGEPSANPIAEHCIPRAWKTVDRVLDVVFWKPRLKNKHKSKAKSKKGKNHRQVASEDEMSDSQEDEVQEEDSRRAALVPGEQPNPTLVETMAEREARTGEITRDDLKDAVWCFFKWRELTHEDATWDSPPRPNDHGYEEYVQAFEAFLEAQKVVLVPLSPAEQRKKDNRPPMDLPVISDPGFEQGGKLMPFQASVTWLYRGWYNKQTGILADEMGLGKTVQVTTFVGMLIQESVFPILIVVPNSTISNWMREFAKWAPHVRAVQYNGDAKSRAIIRDYELYHRGTKNPKFHVLVATYEAITNPADFSNVYGRIKRWEALIIDEGQRLKSDSSLIFRRLKELNTKHRVIMTGTPLNNNIRELFNLMNFLDAEKWHNLKQLEAEYAELDEAKLSELHDRLKPYFLRRVKADVMTDLPPKNEVIVPISMAPLQKEVYKSLLEKNMAALGTLLGEKSSKTKKSNLNNLLMQLRKCMQHPYLIDGELEVPGLSEQETHQRLIEASGKLRFLETMLPKLRERGHRVLLFSQFTMALDVIEDFIQGESYKFLRLDGDTKSDQRQRDMDEFNKPGSDIFIYLLSTRAGGVGINLWSADTVIVFDPDFNPHQDLQAIARAHRMGQTKKVLVFKFMIKGAAEERIVQAGKRKLVLDHLIVQKMDDEEGAEDVETILSFGAKALFEEDSADARYTDQDVNNLIDKLEQQEPEPPTAAGHTAMKFDFAKIWESSTNNLGEVVEEDMQESNSYWAKRIARANELKAQMARQEKTGRGVRRKATQNAVVQDQDFDSPEKPKVQKPSAKRRKDSDDEDEDWKGPARTSASPASSVSGDYASGDDPVALVDQPKPKKQRKTFFDGTEDPHFPFPELLSSNKQRNLSDSEDEGSPIWCHVCGQEHSEGSCKATADRATMLESKRILLEASQISPDRRTEAIDLIDKRLRELDQREAERRAERKRTQKAAAAVAALTAKIQAARPSAGPASHLKSPSRDIAADACKAKRGKSRRTHPISTSDPLATVSGTFSTKATQEYCSPFD
ncbi:hypothetical protein FRB90_008806 [Tulasnella sp. 427]|nr:hypothetical protein FRB90_008806 [Tulasnella sp. 427]